MFERFFAGILAFIFSIFPCVNNKAEYTCKEAVAVTAEFAENESVAIDTPKPVFAADMPESEVISVNGLSRLSINCQLTSPVLFFGNTDFPNPNGVTTSQAGFASDAGYIFIPLLKISIIMPTLTASARQNTDSYTLIFTRALRVLQRGTRTQKSCFVSR